MRQYLSAHIETNNTDTVTHQPDCRDWKAGRSTPSCRDRIHYVKFFCRCRFFVGLFAISDSMPSVYVMPLSWICSIFLLWILRFRGLKV